MKFKSCAFVFLLLGVAFACGEANPNEATAAGGATGAGSGSGIAGSAANAGGAAGASGRACYTAPPDPAAGGAIAVYRLYPEVLCYVPNGVAGSANRVAAPGGAAGTASSGCPAATAPELLNALDDANPQSLSSIWPEWVIDGPTVSSDQCCYSVCMSFNGA